MSGSFDDAESEFLRGAVLAFFYEGRAWNSPDAVVGSVVRKLGLTREELEHAAAGGALPVDDWMR